MTSFVDKCETFISTGSTLPYCSVLMISCITARVSSFIPCRRFSLLLRDTRRSCYLTDSDSFLLFTSPISFFQLSDSFSLYCRSLLFSRFPREDHAEVSFAIACNEISFPLCISCSNIHLPIHRATCDPHRIYVLYRV